MANDSLDYSGRSDCLSGGARRIPIETPVGIFEVWTKRVGNNPDLKVLLLHGGPGCTHEYLEACDSFLPHAGVEYYYYDQLGSGFSDQPGDASLWELDRFVDEVEQVRHALGLGPDNFVLYGQSWGGILAIEYALAHQEQLRGLVISNMMASAPSYTAYAEQVLMPAMDATVLAEIQALEAAGDTDNPRYMELLVPHFYELHSLRMPAEEWPDPVQRAFAHINLRADAGAERTGDERRCLAGPMGSGRGPAPNRDTHPRHRGALRHDGPGAYGDDGRVASAR
jgi:proline iminopeptidase